MKWLDNLVSKFTKKPKKKRGYSAATIGRLTASLASESEYINNTLRYELKMLRARSREASQNNPYGKRFISLVVDNVCGPAPFKFQAKGKRKNGKLDVNVNRAIELTWKDWNKRKNCDLTERNSFATLQRLIVRTLVTDGEVLIRKYKGPEYGKHGYQLQLIDVDRLDEMKNESLANGGAIHMGVEVDAINKPVAYHLLKRKPKDWHNYYTREYDRIPADEIIHLFIPEFAEQIRGVPWIYAAMLNLVNLGAFEEAAVIAARIGAASMGFIESPDDGGSMSYDGEDSQGNPQIDLEAGTFPVLPPGYTQSQFDTKYPDAAIGPFIKACLRGVSSGVNVAYHNLSGDMEGVNYSSARIAELNERDSWMSIQNFIIDHLHVEIYDEWLPMQSLMGTLKINFAGMDKYKEVFFQGRRWKWVDPQKEITAQVMAIDNRLTSKTRVIAEQGNDIEEIFNELAQEQDMESEANLKPKDEGAANDKPEETDKE